MNEVSKKAAELLAQKTKKSNISEDQELKELGLDSLDVVELLLEFEDEFHISFSSEELKKLKKVGDIYELINLKLKK